MAATLSFPRSSFFTFAHFNIPKLDLEEAEQESWYVFRFCRDVYVYIIMCCFRRKTQVEFEVHSAIAFMKFDLKMFEDTPSEDATSCEICERVIPLSASILCGPHGAVVRCLSCDTILVEKYTIV